MKRESISRLVRVIAGEKNPHFLISRVAADARLLELVKKIHGEAGAAAHSPVKSSVTALCETNHITPEFFWERVRLVAYTLQLAPEGEDDDLYATLQLERSATREEIKAAYRRLSLQHHPDRNPGDPQAVEAFMKIHRAYQVLSQEKSREEYDRKLTVPLWNEGYSHSREESPKPQRPPLHRYSRLWPLAIPVVAFLLLVLFVDFQNVQTRKYYEKQRQAAHRDVPRADPAGQAKTPEMDSLGASSSPAWLNARLKLLELKSRVVVPAAAIPDLLARLPSPTGPLIRTPLEFEQLAAEKPMTLASTLKKLPASSSAQEKERPPAHSLSSAQKESGSRLPGTPSPAPEKVIQQTVPQARAAPPPVRRGDTGTAGRQGTARHSAALQKDQKSEESPSSPSNGRDRIPPESPSRVTPSKPGVQMVSVEELQRRLETFLHRYTAAYSARESSRFFSFFEPDARENGELFSSLKPLYVENFVRAEHIDYEIKMDRWRTSSQGIALSGHFSLSVKFFGAKPHTYRGTVHMVLSQKDRSFRVKTLDYRYH